MWNWIAWMAVGLTLEIIGATTKAPTLSEGIQIAWTVDWAKPLIAGAWLLLTGHLFFGWWD
jgi:hypothetical protein